MLLAGLAAAPAPTVAQEDVGFLAGEWSADCESGRLRIENRNGQMLQTGLLGLAGPAAAALSQIPLPATPLRTQRKGNRLLLGTTAPLPGGKAEALARTLIVDVRRLRVLDVTLCMSGKCQTHALDVTVRRCS